MSEIQIEKETERERQRYAKSERDTEIGEE